MHLSARGFNRQSELKIIIKKKTAKIIEVEFLDPVPCNNLRDFRIRLRALAIALCVQHVSCHYISSAFEIIFDVWLKKNKQTNKANDEKFPTGMQFPSST